MVAIVRFVGPQGKSFITRSCTWRVRPQDFSGVIWDKALNKYGQQNFRREVLWQGDANDLQVTRKFNKYLKEYEPEFNISVN
jgi:hypothetical protein